jgi:hypothetical protein
LAQFPGLIITLENRQVGFPSLMSLIRKFSENVPEIVSFLNVTELDRRFDAETNKKGS